MSKARIVYPSSATRKRPCTSLRKRSTPGGTIAPWIVLAGFLVLCVAAWQRHMDDVLVDADPAQQARLARLLDTMQQFRTKQAQALADVWGLTAEDVDKPVGIFR